MSNSQKYQHMPHRMQIGDIHRSVEAAKDAIVEPHNYCTCRNHHRTNAELVCLNILILDSVELNEQKIIGWHGQEHQRKCIHDGINNRQERCRCCKE